MEQGFKTHPDRTVDGSNGLCNLRETGCVCAWLYGGLWCRKNSTTTQDLLSVWSPFTGTKSAEHIHNVMQLQSFRSPAREYFPLLSQKTNIKYISVL